MSFPRGGQQFIQQCCETLASYLVLVSMEMPVGKYTKRDRETEMKREGKEKLVLRGEELLASLQNWMQSSVYFLSDIVRENREYVK